MRRDDGQAIVLVAIVLAGLLLGLGLAVDSGELYVARRAAQTAADSGAWAGGVVLLGGGTPAAATTAAVADATRNGFTAGAGTTVTVSTPTATGPYAGDATTVEVTIVRQVTTRLFPGPRPVTARAVAGAAASGGSQALLVLHPTVNDALSVGGGVLRVTGGGIQVNSSSASAINIGGGSIAAQYTNVRGNVASGDAAKITPAAVTGAPVAADPLAALAGPSLVGLVTRATNGRDVTASATLDPGLYIGGIRIRNNGTVATLNPGVYVTLPGPSNSYGFSVSNNSQVLMANATAGVLIFNTYPTYPTPPVGGQTCGNVDFNGSGQVTLRPQATGTHAGITLYQDRACTNQLQLRNSAAWTLSGTFYVPSGTFTVNATSVASQSVQVIASRFALSGNHSFTIAQAGGAAARVPALLE